MTTTAPPPTDDSATLARRQVRGSALLLAGRGISLGLNLAVQVLTVRYLSKGDYGAFAFALAVVSLASSLSVFGLDKTVSRFAAIYHERRDHRALTGTLVFAAAMILLLGAAVVLLVFALQDRLGPWLNVGSMGIHLLLVLIVLAPVNAFESLSVALFAVLASPRAIFFRRHVLGPGLKLSAVAAVMLLGGNVASLAVAYVVGGVLGIIICAAMLVQLLRGGSLLGRLSLRRMRLPAGELLRFSLPVFGSDIAFLLRSSMVVLFLECFRESTAVAEFRAVLPVARLNELVLANFAFLFIPTASRFFAQGDRRSIADLYRRTAAWIAVLSFPLFAATFSLARPVTVLLFGARYADSAVVLALLSLGYYAHALLGFNSQTLKVLGRLRQIIMIEATVMAVAVGLYLWLIPLYGARGAAVAMCGTMIVHALLNQIALRWNLGEGLASGNLLRVRILV
ncbi:MAG: oligosaccharide flippase family protein, partial [Planctomycetaceae bacterium]